MTLIGYVSRKPDHPAQVGAFGPRNDVDDRTTNPELFAQLNARFGFTLDVAASERNARCRRFLTIDEDGLAQPWTEEVVWCNPPYSSIRPWVMKAWLESSRASTIVLLVPSNRTEQGWWQDLVEPYRDRPGSTLRVEFLRGRLRFIRPGADEVGPNERPPFGCCLLIWQGSQP